MVALEPMALSVSAESGSAVPFTDWGVTARVPESEKWGAIHGREPALLAEDSGDCRTRSLLSN